eukprot:m.66295 g.66295  ORF g.66295 m.66295 type:complete len:447 (+) comp12646_c0_seq6:708-2048(+)
MDPARSAREAITHLCDILKLYGISYMNPETFRLAKHNKPEAIPLMWRVLHDVIIIGIATKFLEPLREGCVADIWQQAHARGAGFVVDFVQHQCEKLSYREPKFYLLTAASTESRRLLLAFAWLYVRFRIAQHWTHAQLTTERFAATRLPPFPEDVTHLHCSPTAAAALPNLMPPHDASLEQRLHALVAAVGSVRAAATAVRCEAREAATRSHQTRLCVRHASGLPTCTPPFAAGAMSVLQTHLLRHRTAYMAHLRLLEARIELLRQAVTHARMHSTICRWLLSVVAEDAKDEAPIAISSASLALLQTLCQRVATAADRARLPPAPPPALPAVECANIEEDAFRECAQPCTLDARRLHPLCLCTPGFDEDPPDIVAAAPRFEPVVSLQVPSRSDPNPSATSSCDILSVLAAAEAGMADEAALFTETHEAVDAARRALAQTMRAALVE